MALANIEIGHVIWSLRNVNLFLKMCFSFLSIFFKDTYIIAKLALISGPDLF